LRKRDEVTTVRSDSDIAAAAIQGASLTPTVIRDPAAMGTAMTLYKRDYAMFIPI
jgi:hypothetical protein